jgi:hypothetical protein
MERQLGAIHCHMFSNKRCHGKQYMQAAVNTSMDVGIETGQALRAGRARTWGNLALKSQNKYPAEHDSSSQIYHAHEH